MENFIGEIRLFCGTFAPVGWLNCDGSLQSISNYDTLYALIGTTYGGDGQNTFALPDLRGRVPVHMGTLAGGGSYALGQSGGTEQTSLLTTQMPAHAHGVATAASGQVASPGNAIMATAASAQTGVRIYSTTTTTTTTLNPQTVGIAGGSQPHDNMQPFQVIRYIIATDGFYPSQN